MRVRAFARFAHRNRDAMEEEEGARPKTTKRAGADPTPAETRRHLAWADDTWMAIGSLAHLNAMLAEVDVGRLPH